jgi:NifU-like protein involved in Fe-S cluster formation
MLHSPKEKRKIILDNYSHSSKQIGLEELKKKSADWQTPFTTFNSLEAGCGDTIHLLIKKKDNYLEKCLFSGQKSCLITVSAANILCSYLEKKSFEEGQNIINNCQAMVEKKNYNLDNYPNLQVFSDIFNYPHRIECLKIVLRGIGGILKANK